MQQAYTAGNYARYGELMQQLDKILSSPWRLNAMGRRQLLMDQTACP